MRYEKFYIGNTEYHPGLFNQLRGKEAAPNRVPAGIYNMINETSSNNGVTKKADSNYIFEAPAITVSVNFAQTVFLQEDDFCASVNILILKGDWLEEYKEAGLYIVSMLKKINQHYDYSFKISKDRLNETVISLPILTSSNIPVIDPEHKYHPEGYIPDWKYMQDYIKELEQDYIKELEQYLIATGLNDYELTDEDRETLEKINERLKDFRVGDLFDIHPTNAYKMNNEELRKVKGNNIILSNSSVNNGVGGYCGRDNIEKGNIITFSDTTTGSDTMFYQSKDFIGYPHVQGMYPYDKEHWKEKQCLYFISAMRKAAGTGWSYSTKFTRKLVAEIKPLLPIKLLSDNSPVIDPTHKYHPEGYIPDWEYMERYVRAIEKLVIKDVVKYKDKMIKEMRNITE